MGRIKELDYNTVVKIAAGEVIDRPASVVRELIDNAIDAGADSIRISIDNGGKSYIELSDNGCGMDAEDLKKCALNHSTSKINKFDDLNALKTLGFRGEALSSIVEVSDTSIFSREKGSIEGHEIHFHFGEIGELRASGMNYGTRVIVRDLFKNLPARKKFLGSDATETRHINREIIKKALAFPEIAFEFNVSGKQKSFSGKKESIFERIADYYPDTVKYLIPVEKSADRYGIYGFITRPAFIRPNRMYQYFFVNGRAVEWKQFSFAVQNAYGNLIPRGQFPAVFLYVEIEPELVDFNVHPMKKEVRFENEYVFSRDIRHAISGALMNDHGISEADESLLEFNYYEKRVARAISEFARNNIEEKEIPFGKSQELLKSHISKSPNLDFPLTNPSTMQNDKIEITHQEKTKNYENTHNDMNSILDYRFVGIIFSTYLILEGDDKIVFVDQHAAHERINYEKLKRKYRGDFFAIQELLIPVKIEVPVEILDLFKEQAEVLNAMGFETEHFGENTFIIRTVPEYIDYDDVANVVTGFIEALYENRDSDLHASDFIDRAIKQMSCKSSIRAGDKINREEVFALLKELMASPNPFSCPHGRPIMFSLSRNDIEKQFKRLGF